MSIFIGIDPGIGGGIGIIDSKIPIAYPMPKTIPDIVELLEPWCYGNWNQLDSGQGAHPVFAIMEQVWGFPGTWKAMKCPRCRNTLKVKQPQGSKSLTTFMRNAGALEGILSALKIPYDLVSPNKWEAAMGVRIVTPRGQRRPTQTEKKNKHKAKAQRLFPEIKVTHAVADALLLAQYCRTVKGGDLSLTPSQIVIG